VTCLKGITGQQIADGLNACLEYHTEWPPGAAQFRGACLGKHIDKHGNEMTAATKASYRKFDRVPQITDEKMLSRRKKAGLSALDHMKGLFDEE